MAEIIVNTSPLQYLHQAGQLELLPKLFGRVTVPGAVTQDVKLEVDHIVPASKKGPSVLENLQTLCSRCNSGKSNSDD